MREAVFVNEPSAKIRPYLPSERIDEVETRIREFIVDNHLDPGNPLPGESWFASKIGVGRPVVREAMRRLEAVGLVHAKRGVGRFVSSFDAENYLRNYSTDMLLRGISLRELNETRCLLEVAMAKSGVEGLTDEDMETLKSIRSHMEKAYAEGIRDPEPDMLLHKTLMGGSNNRLVIAMLDAVLAITKQQPNEKYDPAQHHTDLLEHMEIIDAALARDGERTTVALATHFATTATRLGFSPTWLHIRLPMLVP